MRRALTAEGGLWRVHSLSSCGPPFQSTGRGLGCSLACPPPPPSEVEAVSPALAADSVPLSHQGSPQMCFLSASVKRKTVHRGGLRGARVSDSFLLCIFTSGSVFKMNVCCYTTRTEGGQDSPTRGGQTSPSSLAVGPSPGTPHAGLPAPPPPPPASSRRLPQPSFSATRCGKFAYTQAPSLSPTRPPG